MSKQLFDDLIGVPPASTVDVHAIVTRAKRRRAARQMTGMMAAVAVLAVSAGLMANLGNGGSGTPPITVPAPGAVGDPNTKTSQAPAYGPEFALAAQDRESAQATAERLGAALDQGLRRIAPGARWLASDFYGRPNADDQPPTIIFGDGVTTSDEMFYGGAFLEVGASNGGLGLEILGAPAICPSAGGEKCEPRGVERTTKIREQSLMCQRVESCVQRIGSRGERIVVMTDSTSPPALGGSWAIVSYRVHVELRGDEVLAMVVSNEYGAGGAKGGPHQERPPLTAEQLTAIATDIAGKITG